MHDFFIVAFLTVASDEIGILCNKNSTGISNIPFCEGVLLYKIIQSTTAKSTLILYQLNTDAKTQRT